MSALHRIFEPRSIAVVGASAHPTKRGHQILRALDAGFAQAGVVEVRRTDELLRVAETLASQPPGPNGAGVAILPDGGGQSTLVVDALHEKGIPLAELSPRTSARLRKLLGPAAAVRTPVDVAGAADADPGAFARGLEVLARDPSVGIVMLVGLFGGYAIRFSGQLAEVETEAAASMAATMRALGKGMVVHSQYASHDGAALDALREACVPVIGSLDVACRAVVELHRRGVGLARSARWRPEKESARISASAHHVINGARAEGRVTLDEMEARALLGEVGLAFEPTTVVRSAEEAGEATAKAGCPVATKLLSGHITHKSDAGGVVLDVRTGDEARAAFAGIAKRASVYARTHGLPEEDCAATVSPMLAPPVAELLAGAYRDPQLGPVLTVGAGGIWVEVLRDAAPGAAGGG